MLSRIYLGKQQLGSTRAQFFLVLGKIHLKTNARYVSPMSRTFPVIILFATASTHVRGWSSPGSTPMCSLVVLIFHCANLLLIKSSKDLSPIKKNKEK